MTRVLFYAGAVLLTLFEMANVYFIMPMPGSQRMRSIELAYALYSWRWAVRGGAGVLMLAGAWSAWRATGWRRWLAPALLVVVMGVSYVFNFRMSADHMFLQPTVVRMEPTARNRVAMDRLVVGIEVDGEARAYPLQFIGYHHQVRDTVAGRDVLVSYCTVCRTGRVFLPVVEGATETFRLVGMDHFNAMLEDRTTGSWWRQANGEAVIGPRQGVTMPELPSRQVTLRQWLTLYPHSLVMQADSLFLDEYSKDYAYERGTSRKALTGTDTSSWADKSWVVGMTIGGRSRAYDWNQLERVRVINDVIGTTPVVLVLASDSASFFAFERPDAAMQFGVEGDSLTAGAVRYAFNGKGTAGALVALNASQEFWHSWRTFQPATDQYPRPE
ncbi:MAG: DUF3179 domain-containing (seleno)protein [Gemmatimonas sp.]|jgi:hypothetical protein|uniref:DUF3179 domain-containing (seleno)protein n=1 Tax=Gemmatimonas sp. TaxID=1962908 RepID=UPI00391F2990|nr:DUF3179 domain-containing protein [Gemmatimonadota bacterium]